MLTSADRKHSLKMIDGVNFEKNKKKHSFKMIDGVNLEIYSETGLLDYTG